MTRTTNYSLFESIFSVTPKVTETKFRNFERKISELRSDIRSSLTGNKEIVKDNHVVNSLSHEVFAFMQKDGCNPSPRGRQPFRLSEFEKVKIGFYAQFLTLKSVADAFQVNMLTVSRYRDVYKFPKVSAE